MSPNKINCTPVMGYLADNWNDLNKQTPAVVVNPEARPLDLLAWCWGELMSMQASVDVMISSNDDIKKGDFSALFLHRIEPLVVVFERAIDQLRRDAMQSRGSES